MTQTDIYASRYELEAWSDHQWWDVMNDMIDALARVELTGEEFDSKWKSYMAYIDIPARLDQWRKERQ